MARTPAFRLEADGRDVTAAIRDRLLALRIDDEAETKSDRLSLTLDDRPRLDGAVADLPTPDTMLSVWLGYRETGAIDMGRYRVDEITYSGPPATLEVKATAAALGQDIRAARSRSWHRQTLGDLTRTIAADHRLEARIEASLDAIPLPHLDQTTEGDIAFLARISNRHDAVARPLGPVLAVVRRGTATTASGALLPAVTLTPAEVTRWSYTYAARREAGAAGDKRGGVRAWWWDIATGESRKIEQGSPPYEDIRRLHDSEADARASIATHANTAARSNAELSIDLPGRPDIQAEATLVLSGWRPLFPIRWRITRVTHDLKPAGYTCRIGAEVLPDLLDPTAGATAQ
jgi:uncharacterized protein